MSPRILVADDNTTTRKVIQTLLVASGFDVELAADGAQALERLLARPGGFDLSLLDVHMPSLTGLEVLFQLKSAGMAVPSILMTGHPSKALESAALEAGARTVLRKPIPAEVLRLTIRQIIHEIGPANGPQQ
ncbi:MAG: response regulator [Planctomycetota bacterium]|nr:MAG: response regulator [Planctomycetota bacterium]